MTIIPIPNLVQGDHSNTLCEHCGRDFPETIFGRDPDLLPGRPCPGCQADAADGRPPVMGADVA